MNKRTLKGFAVTAVILMAIGTAAGLTLGGKLQSSGAAFASDLLFAQASAFGIWGIFRLLINLRMFSSSSFSFKSFKRLFRGEQKSAKDMKEDYVQYLGSQPTHEDVPLILGACALLAAASVIVALFA